MSFCKKFIFCFLITFLPQDKVELAPNDTVALSLSNYSAVVFNLSSLVVSSTLKTSLSVAPAVKYFKSGILLVSWQQSSYTSNYYYDTNLNVISSVNESSIFYELLPNGNMMFMCFDTSVNQTYFSWYTDSSPNKLGIFYVNGIQVYLKGLNNQSLMATTDQSGYITIWEYATHSVIEHLIETSNKLIILETIPENDNLLLSSPSSNIINVWSMTSLSIVSTFDTQISTLNVMKLVANDILTVAGASNQVKFLRIDAKLGVLSSLIAFNISGAEVYSIGFTYNNLILVGSNSGLEIYNMSNFQLVKLVTFSPTTVRVVNMDTFGFDLNWTFYAYNPQFKPIKAPSDGYYDIKLNDYSITYLPNEFIGWSQVPNLLVCLNNCQANSYCKQVLYQPSNNCSLLNINMAVQTLIYSPGCILYQKMPF